MGEGELLGAVLVRVKGAVGGEAAGASPLAQWKPALIFVHFDGDRRRVGALSHANRDGAETSVEILVVEAERHDVPVLLVVFSVCRVVFELCC